MEIFDWGFPIFDDGGRRQRSGGTLEKFRKLRREHGAGDGEADHIGLVEKVNGDGTIGTIEGNTSNPQTGQEGVWRRTRATSLVLGYGSPY